MKSRTMTQVMGALFFTSGATSLVFETLWLRGFAIVLGGTVYSMSCVLTAFMGGLAVGAMLAARLVRRWQARGRGSFLRAYGALELLIALYGLAMTPALFYGQEHWLALISRFQSGSALTTLAVHFAFSLVMLFVPTVCMGATLPVLVMGLERNDDTVGLYSFNTFGAATGALAASFVLIYQFGVVVSTGIVAALNVVICAVALWLARQLDGPVSADAPVEEPAAPPDVVTWGPGVLLVLSFFSGLLFFAFELVWNRSLSILLGNRVYVTSITLATVLVCLGIGARLVRVLTQRHGAREILIGSYGVAAASLAVGVLTDSALWLRSPALLLVFVVTTIPVPAIAMSTVFPLLLSLQAEGLPRGVHVARQYAVNTLGAMLGSLLTGYVLFQALGSNRILLAGVGILVLSMVLLSASARGGEQGAPSLRNRVLGAVLVLLVVTAFGFRWNARLSAVPPQSAQVIDEDAYGIFSIARTESGLLSVRCNATELVYLFGSEATQFVQESQAHLPLFFAKRRDEVVVIGSGYGITAGAAGKWPGVKHVDAVEILPQMVAHADRFASGNHEYHHNPRVSVHVADGRHFLAAAGHRYDVISINVSDPYLPGSSSLFSTEFYELVTASLAEDGVVCQHLFGPDVASLFHGFKQHFKHVKLIASYDNGVSVIGSQSPLELRGLEVLEDPTLGPVLANVDLGTREALEERLVEGEELRRKLEAEGPAFVNSDVSPALEFRRAPGVSLLKSNF